MDSLVIIDDVISKGYQNLIESTLNFHEFPWNFCDNITDASKMGGIEVITGFASNIFHSDLNVKTELLVTNYSIVPLTPLEEALL